MQTIENTYQQQTEAPLQLPALPQVGLIRKDSIPAVTITRSQFNIIEIDHTIPERFRPLAIKKNEIPQELTLQDSLLLNLTGKKEAFTNWDISLAAKPKAFSETAFSWFDSSLIKTQTVDFNNTIADTLSQSASFTNDSLKLQDKTLTAELSDTNKESIVKEKAPLQEDWFIAVLTISVLVAGLSRLFWRRYMNNILQSVVYKSTMGKLDVHNVSNFYPSFVLGSLFFFNSSVFIYQVLAIDNRQLLTFNSWGIIPIVLIFLLTLFSLKVLAYRLVGHIFETKIQVREYLMGSSVMSKAFALLIIPVIVMIPFVDSTLQALFVKGGFGLFILLYLIQLARGVRIILSNTFSVYYIILYLCALEILPLTILFKVLFR